MAGPSQGTRHGPHAAETLPQGQAMAFVTSALYPDWKGSLLVGALRGQHLARLTLNGTEIAAEEQLLKDLGERIRDVRQGPDGSIYVLTDNDAGRLLRLKPGK